MKCEFGSKHNVRLEILYFSNEHLSSETHVLDASHAMYNAAIEDVNLCVCVCVDDSPVSIRKKRRTYPTFRRIRFVTTRKVFEFLVSVNLCISYVNDLNFPYSFFLFCFENDV